MTVRITVLKSIRCTPERALGVLRHVERYPQWWPLPVSHHAAEHLLRVRPLPLVVLGLEYDPAEPGDVVRFTYVAGPFRGYGDWIVLPEAEGCARVTYTVTLEPVTRMVALLAGTAAFRNKHRRDIERIISRLENEACGVPST